MWNKPTPKQLSSIPKLREQDSSHTTDTIIHAHFFIADCDHFVSEFDGDDTFFGFVILNGDSDNAEWGYFSFSELCNLKKKINWNGLKDFFEVDYDLHWTPTKVCDIKKIVEAGGSW